MESIHLHFPHSPDQPTDHSIHRRFDRLERQQRDIIRILSKLSFLFHKLVTEENNEMATLSEIQQEIEDTKAEVAANSAVDQSAVILIRRILALVGSAAASATDLDSLKASLETIRTAIHSDEQGLGAAVAEGTAAAPAP